MKTKTEGPEKVYFDPKLEKFYYVPSYGAKCEYIRSDIAAAREQELLGDKINEFNCLHTEHISLYNTYTQLQHSFNVDQVKIGMLEHEVTMLKEYINANYAARELAIVRATLEAATKSVGERFKPIQDRVLDIDPATILAGLGP